MKEYARKFYTSKEWRNLSKLYMNSIHYVCERCGGIAEICHHKQYITPRNINEPNVTLNIDNLEGLCMDCHNKEHKRINKRGTSIPLFDSSGNMIGAKESEEIQEYKQAVQQIESLTLHQRLVLNEHKQEQGG